MIGFGMTDRGKARKENQDCFSIKMSSVDSEIAAVVCDGMGGANAGNVASQLASETFIDRISNSEYSSETELKEALHRAVRETNTIVFEKAVSSIEFSGMGTTLVGAVVSENSAAIINIGDSRAYHVSDNQIKRITRDHSVVEDLILRGEITPEEAQHHPNKNLITKAIGTESKLEGDIYDLNLNKGDYILLCSDGLTNLIENQAILSEFQNRDEVEDICTSLVEKALSLGAPDNVTVVLVRI